MGVRLAINGAAARADSLVRNVLARIIRRLRKRKALAGKRQAPVAGIENADCCDVLFR